MAGAIASAQEPALRVMLNEVAPYSWRDESGIQGLHYEIMRAVAEEAGLRFEFSQGLYARTSRALADKVADLVVTLATPDQEAQGLRIDVLHPVRYLVISRAEAPIAEVVQLRGKLLGVARSAYYGPTINDDEQIQKHAIVDPFQGVRMLVAGRLDAVISTDLLLAQVLRQPQLAQATFAPVIEVGGSGYALHARRDLPEAHLAKLRTAVQKLHKNGRIAAMVKPYAQLELRSGKP